MLSHLGLIFLLVTLNGLFAMSEMAVVSSRKARLQHLADSGHNGARRALELSENPTRFLSTVQVGITTIGVLSGTLGDDAIAKPLLNYLQTVPPLTPYAEKISLVASVVTITFLSLIVGELVPKRLALLCPECIAAVVAPLMRLLSIVALPVVKVLSLSTEFFIWVMRIKPRQEPSVTAEEIKVLLAQGTEQGVFEESEQQLMENVLRLDDSRVKAIMTPRKDIDYLDIECSFDENRQFVLESRHSVLPLCSGGLENVIGFIRTKDLLNRVLDGGPLDFQEIAVPALYVPDSVTLMEILEKFKTTHLTTALVINEYGDIHGLVSLGDVVKAIVGDLPADSDPNKPEIVARQDGTVLVDGQVSIESFARFFALERIQIEDRGEFHTVGGLMMLALGSVPKTADFIELQGMRLEVVDMDGNRVDKILVIPLNRDTSQPCIA